MAETKKTCFSFETASSVLLRNPKLTEIGLF